LNGVSIAEALAGDPEEYVGRYTSYELQQIVLTLSWFRSTTFYSNDRPLARGELGALGITPPNGKTD
jgi:hypothetical protein